MMATSLKGPCAFMLRKDVTGRFSLFQNVEKSPLSHPLGEIGRVRPQVAQKSRESSVAEEAHGQRPQGGKRNGTWDTGLQREAKGTAASQEAGDAPRARLRSSDPF